MAELADDAFFGFAVDTGQGCSENPWAEESSRPWFRLAWNCVDRAGA
ncbi:hypothetical protein [Nonomuraea insulae]|uniref:Uncharacterized protein n=1 Tax=Nonomuraea insulae TaxID=1616787 RepID=A0ABW1CBP1_9ACTN